MGRSGGHGGGGGGRSGGGCRGTFGGGGGKGGGGGGGKSGGGGGRSGGGGGGLRGVTCGRVGKAGGGGKGTIAAGKTASGVGSHGHHQVPGRQVVVQPGRGKSNPVTPSNVGRAQRYAKGLNAAPVLQIPKHAPVPAGVKQQAAQANVQIKRMGGGGGSGSHGGGTSRSCYHQVPGRQVVVHPGRSKSNPVTASDVGRAQRYARGLNAAPVMQVPKYTPVPAGVKQQAAQANVQIKRK